LATIFTEPQAGIPEHAADAALEDWVLLTAAEEMLETLEGGRLVVTAATLEVLDVPAEAGQLHVSLFTLLTALSDMLEVGNVPSHPEL
jgi:hypothetical protein